MTMIPPKAVEQTWSSFDQPVESKRANYPIVTKDQQYALMHEVVVDTHDIYARLAAIGWQRYDGDVWTIQLTARPGYYVTPQELENYGATPSNFPPLG